MEEADPTDQHLLRAAEGWLMLGVPSEAESELEQLSPSARSSLAAKDLSWQVHSLRQDWAAAFELATQQLAESDSHVPAWIHRSYAARRKPGGGVQEAYDWLRPAADRFTGEALIPYNLACYAAQMNRPEEAWQWFEVACQRAPLQQVHIMALADPDLQLLWPKIRAQVSHPKN